MEQLSASVQHETNGRLHSLTRIDDAVLASQFDGFIEVEFTWATEMAGHICSGDGMGIEYIDTATPSVYIELIEHSAVIALKGPTRLRSGAN